MNIKFIRLLGFTFLFTSVCFNSSAEESKTSPTSGSTQVKKNVGVQADSLDDSSEDDSSETTYYSIDTSNTKAAITTELGGDFIWYDMVQSDCPTLSGDDSVLKTIRYYEVNKGNFEKIKIGCRPIDANSGEIDTGSTNTMSDYLFDEDTGKGTKLNATFSENSGVLPIGIWTSHCEKNILEIGFLTATPSDIINHTISQGENYDKKNYSFGEDIYKGNLELSGLSSDYNCNAIAGLPTPTILDFSATCPDGYVVNSFRVGAKDKDKSKHIRRIQIGCSKLVEN